MHARLNERQLIRTGFVSWAIFAVVVFVLSVAYPQRSLIPLYSEASHQFWAGVEPARDYLRGYYYLPASQILFTPFAFAGFHVGGLLWRVLGFGLLTFGLWQWAQILVPQRALLACSLTLALVISGAAGVMRIGQFDAMMWALTLIAAAQVAHGRPGRAAVALALAIALKPTAVVALLLFGAVWPAVGLRALPLVLLVLTAPFLLGDFDYVYRLYVGLAERIVNATQQEGWWNNLATMLGAFGLPIPHRAMTVTRIAAALAVLALALGSRRLLPPPLASFSVFSLGSLYLLLFNPRTEGVGYVGLAIVAAPLAARAWLYEGRRLLAQLLALACFVIGLPGLTRALLSATEPWFKPLLALVVALLVVLPRALRPRMWLPSARESGGERGRAQSAADADAPTTSAPSRFSSGNGPA